MFETIEMADFIKRLATQPLKVIDVREVEEYQSGHLKQARNFPLSTLGEQFTKLDQTQQYYLICRSGKRSERASQFLAEQGYQVTNVAGGMNAWTGEIEK